MYGGLLLTRWVQKSNSGRERDKGSLLPSPLSGVRTRVRERRGESGGCTQNVELLTCRRGGSLVREEWLARTFPRSFAWRTRRFRLSKRNVKKNRPFALL